MFSKCVVLVLAVASLASAAPIRHHARNPKSRLGRRQSGSVSFGDYPGISALAGFDDFYGSGNFGGSGNQPIISSDSSVCTAVPVNIVQQRLAVVQEVAKKVITELMCDVEAQAVIWEQFYTGLQNFGYDIYRESNNDPGYDSNIVSSWSDIINDDGSCSTDDFGFTGSDIGQSTVVPGGNNWDDSVSPVSVGYAKYQADKANWQSQYDSSSSWSYSSSSDGSSDSTYSSSDSAPCDDNSSAGNISTSSTSGFTNSSSSGLNSNNNSTASSAGTSQSSSSGAVGSGTYSSSNNSNSSLNSGGNSVASSSSSVQSSSGASSAVSSSSSTSSSSSSGNASSNPSSSSGTTTSSNLNTNSSSAAGAAGASASAGVVSSSVTGQ